MKDKRMDVEENPILKKLKNRLLQTSKQSTIFFNSFSNTSTVIDLEKICKMDIFKNEKFIFGQQSYKFVTSYKRNDDENKNENKLIENSFVKIYKKNKIALDEKNLHSLFIGSYFIEGYLDNAKTGVFRAPLILYSVNLIKTGSSFFEITNINYNEPKLNNALLMMLANKSGIKWEYVDIDDEKFVSNNLNYLVEQIKKAGFIVSNSSLEEFEISEVKSPIIAKKEELQIKLISQRDLGPNIVNLKNYMAFGVFDIASSSILSSFNEIEENGRADFISEIINIDSSASSAQNTKWNEQEIKTISNLDVSQKTAIANSLKRNQFIWGPPGTGKSETIVNLLANIIFNKKRALFITEKKVASDVVFDRMKYLKAFALNINDIGNSAIVHNQIKSICTLIQKRLYETKEIKSEDYGVLIEEQFQEVEKYKNIFQNNEGKLFLYSQEILKSSLSNYNSFSNISFSNNINLSIENLYLNKNLKIKAIDYLIQLLFSYDLKELNHKNLYEKIYSNDENLKKLLFNLFKRNKYTNKLPLFSKKQYLNFLENNLQDTNYQSWKFIKNKINLNDFKEVFKIAYFFFERKNVEFNFINSMFIFAIYNFNFRKKHEISLENKKEWIKDVKINMKNKNIDDEKFIFELHLNNIINIIMNESFKLEDTQREKTYQKLFDQLNRKLSSIKTTVRIKTYFKDFYELIKIFFPILITSPDTASNKMLIPLIENEFDYAVFDEASQIFIEKCIPAMFRSKKFTIVGDDKQLSPSNFFVEKFKDYEYDDENEDITIDNIDEATFYETESLIDFANGRFPKNMLEYHYRSVYSDLINFSNKRYYDSKLVVVNKNKFAQFPIKVIDVNGVNESQKNIVEAQTVVKLVRELSSSKYYEGKTIGIVTFNAAQQKLIEQLIEKDADSSPSVQALLNMKKGEELFIKNIENVQGDERDIIIFSIGYAKKADGRFINNFGPINGAGGEKRLNVAISRAKERMVIVKSIHSSQMNPNPKSKGAVDFRDFLKYCELLQRDETKDEAIKVAMKNIYNFEAEKNIKSFDSDFEIEVFDEINQLISPYKKYRLDNQVGANGYFIDIAIFDTQLNEYILAIECDGYTYHSSSFDRRNDFERQLYLENRGWKFERILSTHWWDKNTDKKNKFLNDVKSYLK